MEDDSAAFKGSFVEKECLQPQQQQHIDRAVRRCRLSSRDPCALGAGTAYASPLFHMPLCLMQMIIAKDGVSGLFGRGLTTKLISNGIQVCYDGGRER